MQGGVSSRDCEYLAYFFQKISKRILRKNQKKIYKKDIIQLFSALFKALKINFLLAFEKCRSAKARLRIFTWLGLKPDSRLKCESCDTFNFIEKLELSLLSRLQRRNFSQTVKRYFTRDLC